MNTLKKQAWNIAIYLAVAIAAAALAGAWTYSFFKPALAQAVEGERKAKQALADAVELQRLSNASMARTLARVDELKESSNALQSKLNRALARSADCSLSGDVGRVLRDAVPADPGAAASSEVRAKAAAALVADRSGTVEVDGRPVSCKAIAVWATKNIAISQENSELFSEAVRQYEIVREAYGR